MANNPKGGIGSNQYQTKGKSTVHQNNITVDRIANAKLGSPKLAHLPSPSMPWEMDSPGSLDEWLDRYHNAFGDPIVGRTRSVFVSDDYVYKLPTTFDGSMSNLRESNHNDDYIPIAPCELLPDGVLKMKRVDPVRSRRDLPEWTDWVDCAQVGYLKSGELVAYDL